MIKIIRPNTATDILDRPSFYSVTDKRILASVCDGREEERPKARNGERGDHDADIIVVVQQAAAEET